MAIGKGAALLLAFAASAWPSAVECSSECASLLWRREFDNGNLDGFIKGVAVNSAGDIFAAGWTARLAQKDRRRFDLILMKYSASGAGQWVVEESLGRHSCGANAVAIDPDGDVVVAGWSTGSLHGAVHARPGHAEVLLMKYAPSGARRWTKLRGSGVGTETAVSVVVSADGDIFVLGNTDSALDGATHSGGKDLFLLKYSSSGDWMGTVQHGSGEHDVATDMALDSQGGILIAGSTGGTFGDGAAGDGALVRQHLFLMKVSASHFRQWVKSPQRGNASSIAGEVVISAEGDVFVAEERTQTLMKFSPIGDVQWRRHVAHTFRGGVFTMAINAADGIYMVGQTAERGENITDDLVLLKYSTSGVWQWTSVQRALHDDDATRHSAATAVAVDSEGDVIVAGTRRVHDDVADTWQEGFILMKFSDLCPTRNATPTTVAPMGTTVHKDVRTAPAWTTSGTRFRAGSRAAALSTAAAVPLLALPLRPLLA